MTVSTGSTVKGRLRLAEKINAEYMSDGFFGLVVPGETEDREKLASL